MNAVRWMILAGNLFIIALVVFLAYYYNFDKNINPGGFFDQEELPYDFNERVGLYIPPKVDAPKPRGLDFYDSVKKALWIKPPEEPPPPPPPPPPPEKFNEAKLSELVKNVESVIYSPADPSRSGAYLKIGAGEVIYFQVGDAIIYGDKYPSEDFWLDSVEMGEHSSVFRLIFRDVEGNKSQPREYKCASDPGIIIK
jgi:hypothetical protein